MYFSLRDIEDYKSIIGFHSNHKYNEVDLRYFLHLSELVK